MALYYAKGERRELPSVSRSYRIQKAQFRKPNIDQFADEALFISLKSGQFPESSSGGVPLSLFAEAILHS
jgi:hypothetical protein